MVAAIVAMFAVWTVMSLTLSARATERARHRAVVVQLAARQRTLAERYVEEILLARQGAQADPAALAEVLRESAHVLLDGGTAPGVNGDDDEYDAVSRPRFADSLAARAGRPPRRRPHQLGCRVPRRSPPRCGATHGG